MLVDVRFLFEPSSALAALGEGVLLPVERVSSGGPNTAAGSTDIVMAVDKFVKMM